MKVLYYIYGLNFGGAESFIYNLMGSLPDNECELYFCLQSSKNENTKLLSLINQHKNRIFYITPYNKNPYNNKVDFLKVLEENKFDIVHFHMNSLLNYSPIEACMKKKIKVVVHSHNSKSNGGIIGKIIHNINKQKLKNAEIGRFACGEEAGKWFFDEKKYYIINNGIETNIYRFNQCLRNINRKKYDISDDCMLVGHIGRFTKQKNHNYIIEIFSEIKKKKRNSKLLLIGDGKLKGFIEEKINSMGLSDDIILAGNVDNVNELLNAMDVMVFPSFFEGLPFALIEAQASGLPIVASDVVTKGTKITDLLSFLSLSDNCKIWAEKIIQLALSDYKNRAQYADLVSNSPFDSKKTANQIMSYYQSVLHL